MLDPLTRKQMAMLKTLLLAVSSGALCSAKAPGRHFRGLQELHSHAESAGVVLTTQPLDFSKGVDRFAPRTFEESIVAVYSTWNLLDRMVLTPGIHIVPWAFGMFLTSTSGEAGEARALTGRAHLLRGRL